MSYFDDASLVMIPSGYKTSKVYSVKPTDGSGDLTFSRSNDTATRVNSAGLIEKVRTNLILQSQTFDNASWTKDGATVTANATTAPDGTTTADKVLETATTAVHNIYQIPTLSSNIYSISFFVKKAERFKVAIADRNSGGYVAFNLNTGAIIESLLFSGKIQSLANDWYRVTITSASAVSILNPQVFILPDSYTTGVPALITYAGSATSGLFVWGAQLETGDIATDYIATTSAAVSVGPVANVPRLDYLNSSCPRLLLEPQRQNVITFSEQMDNAAWTKGFSSITANAVNSPSGYQDADKLVEDSSNSEHYLQRSFTTTASTNYSLSGFFKAGERSQVALQIISLSAPFENIIVKVNLTTGTITEQVASNGGVLVGAAITALSNGWYRVSVTGNIGTKTNMSFRIYTLNNSGALTYIGDGTSGAYVWGAQLEEGAYATSYIPTLGAAVTRGIDRAVKSSISSLIGQSAGTLYGEFTLDSSETINRVFSITGADWNTDGSIRLDIISNKPEIYARKAGADIGSQGSINYTISKGQTIKWALVYTASTMKLFIDGAQRGTTTSLSTTPPACSELFVNELGGGFSNASQNNQRTLWSQVLLFTSALSDADAAALTA